jgi:hypothetical protein
MYKRRRKKQQGGFSYSIAGMQRKREGRDRVTIIKKWHRPGGMRQVLYKTRTKEGREKERFKEG